MGCRIVFIVSGRNRAVVSCFFEDGKLRRAIHWVWSSDGGDDVLHRCVLGDVGGDCGLVDGGRAQR